MKRYRKAIVAFGAAVTAFVNVTADGTLDNADWRAIALAALGAIGVYAIPNTPAP